MKKNIILILWVACSAISAQQLSVYEGFKNCQWGGWSIKNISGNSGFKLASNDQAVVEDQSCMVSYVQEDPGNAPVKQFQLISPEYNLVSGLNYYFVFNIRYIRPINATLTLSYDGPKGKVTINLPTVADYSTYSLTIASSTGFTKTKFTFEYAATVNDFGNRLYLDDFLFLADNADCARAQTLTPGAECIYGHTYPFQYAQSGGQACAGEYMTAIFYKYIADFTGLLELKSTAGYNNAVTVFEGACGSLVPVNCYNRDEFGFKGEAFEMNVTSGKTYFFKVSRKINDFGADNGLHCLQINKLTQSNIVRPPHDICTAAIPISVNGNCQKSVNYYAEMEGVVPPANTRSRADVWYKFTANTNKVHQIVSHADFAEVVSVYKGNCAALEEVAIEQLGGKLNFTPQSGKEYFVQVSGYFSTIEGDLCLEVKEIDQAKPANDNCISATATPLNTQCNEIQFYNNNISATKPSCVVYSAPDVWYSFVAPAEKEVALRIDAGFIYHWAVFEGPCTSLNEISCGRAPDPCQGYLTVKGLVPGTTYYLQILAATYPLKPGEGRLCVRIDEASKTSPFEKLRLSLSTECLHGVLGRVSSYSVNGGAPAYNYYGPDQNTYFLPGEEISAFVEDASGCRAFATDQASCAAGSKCKNSNLDIDLSTDCIKDQLGRQTGEVTLNYTGKGGTGAYYFYGNATGATLKHGDSYTVVLIDSDSCYVIEKGIVNCPPFTCAQSNLKVSAAYDCVDTLLKARLRVDVSGFLGNITFKGDKDGDLLDQGSSYKVQVTDEAGCTSEATGSIVCKFDSCAYARPALDVSYICLHDSIGNTSGLAELVINGSSKAGGVSYIGNQPGQILRHLDSYQVILKDAFGCSVIREGIINCVPLSSSDPQILATLRLVPNPNFGDFEVKMNSGIQEEVNFSICTPEGRIFQTESRQITVGENRMAFNLSGIPRGIYYIKMDAHALKATLKWVKL
ncbi:MAG: hypothetical protein K1X68_13980 [Saprospiraceae bacterium]|nr:hypothetical protein [Saprospiraceae bacterium]HMW39514.1 hypothetical protein [Saprospiraceae bacterium]HMX89589.1 hypothetical protein [Saprospiraceae bacterium]HMZ41033.1 hypothetical protein [Saprospiraceae bacterium]HNB31434.1 hypothetical protein [Saprospiraceae bacterium]